MPRARFRFRRSVCGMAVSAALAAVLLLPTAPLAQDGGPFAAEVSPPRLVLQAKPGQILRERLEIANAGDRNATYRLRSADWMLSDSGGLRFIDDQLVPNSCRPWLRLERPSLVLAPRQRHRYRFEVHVPEDATRRECRLAILLEQPDQTPAVQGPLTIPISGRIAVIVYVAVGGAAPELVVHSIQPDPKDAALLMLQTENRGDAHGRFAALLEARDATGQRYQVEVSNIAVLAGQTRELEARLRLPVRNGAAMEPRYPLRLQGELAWDGGRIPIDQTLNAAPEKPPAAPARTTPDQG